MNNKLLKIATRNSPLALVQTEIIKRHLQSLYPTLSIDILPMSTAGDRHLERSLATIGGKGLFVKELEQAIIDGRADLAVHSSKDMPMELPNGLTIAVFYKRDDPRDVFISNDYKDLSELPADSVIGTASLRRQALIKSTRPDLTVKVLRGNVQTRLKKLDDNEYTAIILAAAGLDRLNLQSRITNYFNPEVFTPAVAQGILCIECRSDDHDIIALLKPLHHEESAICAIAERVMNCQLQGGCQIPIGAYATISSDQLTLRGLVGDPDGRLILRALETGDIANPEQLGMKVANKLLAQGANSILKKIYQHHD